MLNVNTTTKKTTEWRHSVVSDELDNIGEYGMRIMHMNFNLICDWKSKVALHITHECILYSTFYSSYACNQLPITIANHFCVIWNLSWLIKVKVTILH